MADERSVASTVLPPLKVFLSHARPSKPLVRRVAAALPPHVECWLDQDEMGPGQKFPARIEAGIRTG